MPRPQFTLRYRRWPPNLSHAQTLALFGFVELSGVGLSLGFWLFGFHLYAVAFVCLLALSLVCGAIGFYRERKGRALYGPDSQEWNEIERRGREFGKICGIFAAWPGIIAMAMHLTGYPQSSVVVAFAVALTVVMALLGVARLWLRRKWPPIKPPATQPQP